MSKRGRNKTEEKVGMWTTPLLRAPGLGLELGGWIGIKASCGGIRTWTSFLASTVGRSKKNEQNV